MIPLTDEDRLLLVPGPTPVHREILDALARPTISHTSGQLAETMKFALERLKMVAGNRNGKMFVFAGSGTLAQESALLNFVTPGDRVLVASNGFFASRLHAIAQQHGMSTTLREARPGTSITPDELDTAIRDTEASVVAFTHVETSTGAMAPLSEFIEVIRRHQALSIVDGVAGFGGVSESMDDLGIDVLLTGAQKALGVPPGLALIAVGAEAWRRREARTEPVPTYYADLIRWAPIMEQPDTYFSTHPVNLIQALAKAMEVIVEEGLAARFERHRRLAKRFREGLRELGFELFTDPAYLAPTLSAVLTPVSVASSEFRRRLHGNGVVAAGGINDGTDRIVRFGHMGNITDLDIAGALSAIEQSLNRVG